MIGERIFDRPRVVLPGPLGGVIIEAGRTKQVNIPAIRPMRAPYWLSLHALEELHVSEIKIGNESCFDGSGSIPSGLWNALHPEHLIPIDACNLYPGANVVIGLYNWSFAAIQTTLAFWGTSIDEQPLAPVSADPPPTNIVASRYWK